MGIAIEGIANYEYADAVRSFVSADGQLRYFIDRFGTSKGIAATTGEINIVDTTLKYLDSITGMVLTEVQSPSEAEVFFFKARPGYYEDINTIGLTEISESGILVSWAEQDSQDWREYTTIQHEIGHLFALKHPYGDGFNPLYEMKDTVMSYNSEYYSVNSYSDSDKLAMKAIWGEDRKTFVPGRGTHVGTVFADKFYLKDFDGYGEGSADIIQGFNAANGDELQFTTNGVGWDPVKQYYSFWVASNSQEQYISGYESQRVKTFRWKGDKRRVQWSTKQVPVYGQRETNNVGTVVTRSDNNNLIYNRSNGQLFIDRNGASPGLGDGGLVAILQGAPALSTDNISWFTS